jgi:diguanylate cyclase (GGDEF)-like protein
VKLLLSQQAAIKEMAEIMASQVQVEVNPFLEEVLHIAARAQNAPAACLHLADQERDQLNLVAGFGLDPVRARSWARLKIEGNSPPADAYRMGQVIQLDKPQNSPGLHGLVSGPVLGFATDLGVISLLWHHDNFIGPDQDRDDFILAVGNLLGIAIEHAGLISEMVDNLSHILQLKSRVEERNQQLDQLNQRLAELSVTDGLTGLYNHRYLSDHLVQAVETARERQEPLTVLMADLDHFKRVNDQLGHQAGDLALALLGGWLKSGVRQVATVGEGRNVDTVGRYGGEEFLIILPKCDLTNGKRVAEKLRLTVARESHQPPFEQLGGFTISFGVAQLEPDHTPDSLLAAADEALYQAKSTGRNRVVAAGDNLP